MQVELVVTRTCHHCCVLERELKSLGVPYAVRYGEEDQELQDKYGLRGSPNIIVDGELVFRGMPGINELREYFAKRE